MDFNTAKITDNEVVKAEDFDYGFKSFINNFALGMKLVLLKNKSFVIGGKVKTSLAGGRNLSIEPIFAYCNENVTGYVQIVGTDVTTDLITFDAGSSQDRIDIVEVCGVLEDYDEKQRAINDAETGLKTYPVIPTKQRVAVLIHVKKGTPGINKAPETTQGYVKLAELKIPANALSITDNNIYNITSDVDTVENTLWTNEKDIVINIGTISDVNERYRVDHNNNGTHKDSVIHKNNIDLGIDTNQLKGSDIPMGGESVSIQTTSYGSTTTLKAIISALATSLTSILNNGVTNVAYNATDKKINKTINGSTTEIISLDTLKTDMGLNNVENTKLSTWSGSSNLTTSNQGTFGSASTKTAGSAVGNVPLVGTALGTTNNNIVVTDTSGKLKPSGTTIGSAAGKDVGIAANNVPEIGTALVKTAANATINVVCTDANGKLKTVTTVTNATNATNATNLGAYTETKLNNILVGSATPTNYATKKAYAVGAYVWYSNKLYRCITAVASTSTAWESAKWTEVVPLPISVNSATTASKVGSATVGSTTNPIYLNAGVPTKTTYTLGKSVPSDAVFTDTNTTYAFQTGTANGTIGVKASTATAYSDVSVKGLAAAAYKAMDTTLSSSSTNPITNSGLYNAIYGITISATQSGTGSITGTGTKKFIAKSTAITLATGTMIKILFTTDCYYGSNSTSAPSKSDSYYPLLSVNNGTNFYPIKSYQNGTLDYLPCHKVVSGLSDKGYWWWWRKGTTMTLMFDSTSSSFVVMDDPTVLEWHDTTGGFIVKANGLIEQWGIHTRISSGWVDVYFPISFISKPTLLNVPAETDNSNSVTWKYFATEIYTDHFRYNNNGQKTQQWNAIGY